MECPPARRSALLALPLAAWAQFREPPQKQEEEEDKRLPNGKRQSEEMRKADYEANLKDLDAVRTLLDGVEAGLKKSEGHVLSVQALKDLEQIEKISRRVRSRMTRY